MLFDSVSFNFLSNVKYPSRLTHSSRFHSLIIPRGSHILRASINGLVCQKASAKLQAIEALGSLLSALWADLFHTGRVRHVLQLCKKTCFRKGFFTYPGCGGFFFAWATDFTWKATSWVLKTSLVRSSCSFKGVDEGWYMFEAMFIGVRVPLTKNLILAKWNSMRHVANKHQDHPDPLHSQRVPMKMTLSQGSGLKMVYLTTWESSR